MPAKAAKAMLIAMFTLVFSSTCMVRGQIAGRERYTKPTPRKPFSVVSSFARLFGIESERIDKDWLNSIEQFMATKTYVSTRAFVFAAPDWDEDS
jgi:hypothetical protein